MKTLITCILLLFCISIFSQQETQSNNKMLSEKLLTASKDEKSELYCKLSNLYLDSTGNKSLIFAQKSLQYAEITNNREDFTKANLQLASVFMNQSNWDKSLECLKKAESELKSLTDLSLQHSIYNQFGVVYKYSGQFELSLEYYTKALNVARNSQSNSDIMASLNNIGNVLILQKKYDAALQIYKYAEKECILSNNQGNHIASIYNNIGYIYFVTENFEEARIAWNKSIGSLDKNKDFQRYAVLLNNLAELEIATGNYEQAEINIKTADSIHQNHKYKDSQKNLYLTSYHLYYNIGKYQEAINYLNKYINLKDSIYTEELNSNLSKLKADYDFVKLENESIIKDNEIKRKNLTSKILTIVIVLITVFITLLFSILIKIKKLNLKLNSLNNILEVKNEEIESNLQYAKLIQSAITHNSEISQNIVLFDKPKFGVGGDFFLHRKIKNKSFFILGDCTGHGTSGAILSVFAIKTINNLLTPRISPENIVNNLNLSFLTYITASDNLKNESLTISILCVQNNKVSYAGSRQKVWHFCQNSNTLFEYKTDSFIIGQEKQTSFNTKSFDVKPGDVVFMSSDGFADQFGEGEKGKYKYERFRKMLTNWTLQGIEGTIYLDKQLGTWQGKAEQTDDIMVMAIKI